jgi:hypothetical protein
MLKQVFLGGLLMVTVATYAAAQAPQSEQPRPAGQSPAGQAQPAGQTPPAGQQPATAQQAGTVMLVGCLVREQDIPGRKPNVAERAGVLEDYVLTGATRAPQGGAGTPGATGTSGSGSNISSMYKVEGIADDKLKDLLGKRVEVTGREDADDKREVSPSAAPGAATPASPDADMPEFEATAIREVPGSCPPASR